MNEFEKNLEEELAALSMPPEEKERAIRMLKKMLAMGIGVVYGDEDLNEPDGKVDCTSLLDGCKSRCCTFNFALTKEEAEKGIIEYNQDRKFFIAREEDGYCPHMDRQTYACNVYENRPNRCRVYDCTGDANVWF